MEVLYLIYEVNKEDKTFTEPRVVESINLNGLEIKVTRIVDTVNLLGKVFI